MGFGFAHRPLYQHQQRNRQGQQQERRCPNAVFLFDHLFNRPARMQQEWDDPFQMDRLILRQLTIDCFQPNLCHTDLLSPNGATRKRFRAVLEGSL